MPSWSCCARSANADKWERGADKPLKAARTCYRHIAGELGVALFEGLLARGTLAARDGHCVLTESGAGELREMGVALPACALSADARASRRFAHACFDWSERRDHLAGALAVSLLDHSLDHGWLRRTKDSRALQLTPPGERALARWIRN